MGIADDMLAEVRAAALTMPERLELELNDSDNGARLLAVYGDDLVFVDGKGWAVWDGKRFSFRSGALAAMEMADKLREIVVEEAMFARRSAEFSDWEVAKFRAEEAKKRTPAFFATDEDARDAMRAELSSRLKAHATKCGNLDKQKKALEACEWRRRAEIDDMDSDPYAFVCENGQIDLRAAARFKRTPGMSHAEVAAERARWLRATDRSALPSRCAGVPFDPSAKCPQWEAAIELILPVPEIRACAQRIFGACLLGENTAQICVLLRGPGGNGKSTVLNLLQHVLGNRDGYAAACKVEMFLDVGKESSGGPTAEEIHLPGARAYIATEPAARDVLSAKKIKGLTGGDRRMSRGLNSPFFFWTPRGIPLISCNRTPKIKDEDEGTKRRLVFLPFDVNLRALPIEKQRPQAEVEAALRAEGSGILNWLLDGFAAFVARGVDMPEQMKTLKASLLESADPVGVFIAEMTTPSAKDRLNVTEFYKVYERWCDVEGRALYQPKTVGDVMVEKGFERTKYCGRSCWRGLSWSELARDLVREVLDYDPAPPPEEPEQPPF
ncbi:phage/plasmid primase, P4 family [Tropicimonas sp. IMCC34043]|uniref:DNA primase family protein n=1 Tax=Tropicimonas sp. IMCC34043 TaxID=2248760 RepID=UPI000E246965|nr:phage/plasmid primase, P4 family [Tropicimonas sp. IMCC34043]